MKKINEENVKRFINSGKHHEDSVLIIFVALCCLSCFIAVFNYTLESIIAMVPFVIFSLIYYIKFRTIKKQKTKEYDLFVGLGCIVMSVQSQCAFFLMLPGTLAKKLIFTGMVFLLNVIVVVTMIFVANHMINNNTKSNSTVIAGSAAGGALFGMCLSRFVGGNVAGCILFAVWSLACSMFSICLVRYYYACVLENFK